MQCRVEGLVQRFDRSDAEDLLDLVRHLSSRSAPSSVGLQEVRRVLDGLLGGSVATGWTDERYAEVATGRAVPTPAEARQLGALAARLPVFS